VGVGLAFRFAEPVDVLAVVDLVESAYRGEVSRSGWTTEADLLDGQRTDAEEVSAALAKHGSRILLAEDRTGLVGCCHLEQRPEGQAYFGMFSVRPGQQGQGLGKAILEKAEQLAREDWGSTTMVMSVIAQRRELIAWYERRGYQRTGGTQPFPYGNERFGIPKCQDLHFVVLAKVL
jgi:GNAT superfamily N-acetyltransferase